jgi:outer membrane protein assembly factor BamB
MMNHSSFIIHHWCVAGLLVAVSGLCFFGCRPALETSEQARPLPLLERDPAEDGMDAGRWPQWRGRNGSGVVSAGHPAIRFSDEDGYRWKTPAPGRGNSSPVVWDNVVLLTTELADAKEPMLAVLCFDRTDGKLLWQADAAPARGRTHEKNGHASATVATDGQRIFASFGGAGLFCYDFSGKRLWHVDFGPIDHLWGLASSPVLFGSTVIQLCDYEGDSFVAAFDKLTGRQVWRTPRASQGSWSTPALVEADAGGRRRTEMIVNGGSGGSENRLVIAYDPNDGRELWRAGETTELVAPTPLACNGLVYSLSGRNGPIIALRPGGDGDVAGTHVVWKTTRGGPYIPSGVCYRNRLYVITDIGMLTCYDAGDGRQIWQSRLAGPFTSSLIAADGRIYATNERGTVFVVSAGDTFELLAQNEMHSPCLATPAVADGELLIRTKTDLYCMANDEARMTNDEEKSEIQDPKSQVRPHPNPLPTNLRSVPGEGAGWPLFRGDPQATGVATETLPEQLDLLWTFSTAKGGFESTAAIVGGTVYIGCTDGKLYALDLAGGEMRWEFATPLGFSASAAVRDGLVYIGDTDGKFYCLDAKTGRKKWDFETGAEINSSANFHGRHVLFGSQDAYLYCLDADSGKLVWKFESPDQIRCFPAVLDNLGFVAGCDGHLHAIDLTQGKETGAVNIQAPTGSTPAIMDGTVFVGTEGHQFLAIDPRKAKILWSYESPERGAPFRSSAAVTPRAVVVGSRDKRVYALDPKTGRSLWTFSTKGRVDSSPVVAGPRAFVGSADGRVYALDLKTGEKRWQFEAGGAVLASPAVAEGRLVIGNDAGQLYCFGKRKQ